MPRNDIVYLRLDSTTTRGFISIIIDGFINITTNIIIASSIESFKAITIKY